MIQARFWFAQDGACSTISLVQQQERPWASAWASETIAKLFLATAKGSVFPPFAVRGDFFFSQPACGKPVGNRCMVCGICRFNLFQIML